MSDHEQTKELYRLYQELDTLEVLLDKAAIKAKDIISQTREIGGEIERIIGGQIKSYLLGSLNSFRSESFANLQPGNIYKLKEIVETNIEENEVL